MSYGAHSPCYCKRHRGGYARKYWVCLYCAHGQGCTHRDNWGWYCASVIGRQRIAKRQG